MATPTRLKLLRPLQVWIVFNSFLFLILVASFIGIYKISIKENQKLINSQSEILIKSHFKELETGNYRAFVEGVGKEYSNLFVSVVADLLKKDNIFIYGEHFNKETCNYANFKNHKITICRPYSSPLIPFVVLLLVFIFISILVLFFIRSLENTSLSALVVFIRETGIAVTDNESLFGILSKIKEIKAAPTKPSWFWLSSGQLVFSASLASKCLWCPL
ncbi:MAG: hypothetical protein HY843_07315 [Bdellovibrio sp.]|nr:hypothetical protein [Bdellovibrio sp.]